MCSVGYLFFFTKRFFDTHCFRIDAKQFPTVRMRTVRTHANGRANPCNFPSIARTTSSISRQNTQPCRDKITIYALLAQSVSAFFASPCLFFSYVPVNPNHILFEMAPLMYCMQMLSNNNYLLMYDTYVVSIST